MGSEGRALLKVVNGAIHALKDLLGRQEVVMIADLGNAGRSLVSRSAVQKVAVVDLSGPSKVWEKARSTKASENRHLELSRARPRALQRKRTNNPWPLNKSD